MLEHLIYVNTWYPKYDVELAEQTHYKVFVCIQNESLRIEKNFFVERQVEHGDKFKS